MPSRLSYIPRAERQRVQVIGKLTVEKESGERSTCLCNTLNMSISGALVETGAMIQVGSVLHYTFSLPGLKNLIDITGEVMRRESRVREAGSGGGDDPSAHASAGEVMTCYGIRFLEVRDSDKEALKDFLLA